MAWLLLLPWVLLLRVAHSSVRVFNRQNRLYLNTYTEFPDKYEIHPETARSVPGHRPPGKPWPCRQRPGHVGFRGQRRPARTGEPVRPATVRSRRQAPATERPRPAPATPRRGTAGPGQGTGTGTEPASGHGRAEGRCNTERRQFPVHSADRAIPQALS